MSKKKNDPIEKKWIMFLNIDFSKEEIKWVINATKNVHNGKQ